MPARTVSSLPSMILRVWRHLRKRRQRQFYGLLAIMIAGSFAEIVSIGSVLPLLGVLTAPDKVFASPLARPFVRLFGIETPQQMLLPTVVAFGVVAVVGGLVRLLMIYASTRYSYAVGADISVDMYRRTLYQPYAVHVAANSSELIAGITAKSGAMTGSVLMPLLNLLSSLFLIGGVILALLTVNPMLTGLVFAVVGGAYWFIMLATRRALQRNSEIIARDTGLMVKALQEGLGGIRDVLIDGTQELHSKVFERADYPLRLAHGRNHFISASPRYVIETIGMIAIAGFAYFSSGQPGGINAALPTLAALALGAQRLLPMLQQGYASFATIRGASASIRDVLEILDRPLPADRAAQVEPIPFQSRIELHDVSFRYGTGEPVLTNISLSLAKGKRYGFVGTTGSGKSTLVDIVMGLLDPTHGVVAIDGAAISAANRRRWQRHIAHVPQAIFLSDATLAENIAFGVPVDEIDGARVTYAAQLAQLASTVETWPLKYQTVVGERGARLSGGQRQRVGIARALYRKADVLIFDEATSALDTDTEAAVMEAIDALSEERTILMIAHRVSTLAGCDEIFEVVNGTVRVAKGFDTVGQPRDD